MKRSLKSLVVLTGIAFTGVLSASAGLRSFDVAGGRSIVVVSRGTRARA